MLKSDFDLRRDFPHVSTVADVPHPIIGTNFLEQFNPSLSVRRWCLTDDSTGLSATANTIPVCFSVSHISPLHLLAYTLRCYGSFPTSRTSPAPMIRHHTRLSITSARLVQHPSSGTVVLIQQRSALLRLNFSIRWSLALSARPTASGHRFSTWLKNQNPATGGLVVTTVLLIPTPSLTDIHCHTSMTVSHLFTE